MSKESEQPKSELVKVKLAKEHIHRGLVRQAGETIEVRKEQAAWLKQQQVIE